MPLACALGTIGFGCLEAPDQDVPLSVFLQDPTNAPSVVTLPDYAAREPLFARSAEYLRGFAQGEPIWYWAIDGVQSTLIAPSYDIIGPNGDKIQPSVIDALPGDAGYSPWWRIIEYRVTTAWTDEVFTSRDAIDAGVRAGLLTGPTVLNRVLNAPVSLREVEVFDGEDTRNRATLVWYRHLRAWWLPVQQDIIVSSYRRTMRADPVYIFQRINQTFPLHEMGSGFDLTDDDDLNDSNNVFAKTLSDPGYTPLWEVREVRTTADYLSIDSALPDGMVGLSAEAQFYDPGDGTNEGRVLSSNVVSVSGPTGILLNCPIQSESGQFR